MLKLSFSNYMVNDSVSFQYFVADFTTSLEKLWTLHHNLNQFCYDTVTLLLYFTACADDQQTNTILQMQYVTVQYRCDRHTTPRHSHSDICHY